MASYKLFNRLVKLLEENIPPAFPIVVRRSRITPKLNGDCSKTKKKFLIRINNQLSENEAIHILLHEWSHAIAWNHLHDSPKPNDWHDASWGVAYSKVYNIYEKVFVAQIDEENKKMKSKLI